MKRVLPIGCFCFLAILLALFAGAQAPNPQSLPKPSSDGALHYHDHLPPGPLPKTLDATLFRSNDAAFVAYTLAGRIEPVLYQVPCSCGCDKEQGHTSLLDCFTGMHGSVCHICQKEVLFCYLRNRKHQKPDVIRESIAKGEMSRFDFKKVVGDFYKQIRKSEK